MKVQLFEYLNQLTDLCFKMKIPFTKQDLKMLNYLFINIKQNNLEISFSEVITWIKMQDAVLPLACLWQLQHNNILQFTTYIYYNVNLIDQISSSFNEMIWSLDSSLKNDHSEILAGLLTELLNLGTHSPRDVFRLGQQLVDDIVEKFVNRLLCDSNSTQEPVPFFDVLDNNPACVRSRLQAFYVYILKQMIETSPESISLEDAMNDQVKLYTSSKTSPIIKGVFNKVISKLPADYVVNELSEIVISKEDFNWQWLLTSVSMLVSLSKEGSQSLKSAIVNWLTQALSRKDTGLLAAALLCARQGCAENSQWFGSYSSWFGGLQIRSAASFNFFFDFLSELVPYEPVLYLKIHVNKVPTVPANCHGVVADYAVLAKTRLADLNQTTDYMGLFGEYTTSEQEGREADVYKVIMHFNQTKEVMKVVLEASIFRRQFFEKVFLSELLKDANPLKADFIDKLYSIGKIPHGLYNRWKLYNV